MKVITYNEFFFDLSHEERKNFTGIVKWKEGDIVYFKNNKWHREDGPAWITSNNFKSWWFEGKLHNLNGPARIWPDGTKQYWINGIRLKNCNSDEALQLYADLLKLMKMKEQTYEK